MTIPQPVMLKIIEHFRRAGAVECNRCHSQDRSIIGQLFCISEFRPEPPPPYTEISAVVVICQRCGSMEFFSAVTLGIVDSNTGSWRSF